MEIINETIIIYTLLGSIIVLSIAIIRLEKRIDKFFIGKDNTNIEESIVSIKDNLEKLIDFKKDSTIKISNIEKDLKKSIQGIETVRFNPFKGTGIGGNQSFSTTFINKEGKGVVISSIHSRERVSVFSKPIKNYSSEYELSEEEKMAIKEAKKTLE